jgi:hypothetical protein
MSYSRQPDFSLVALGRDMKLRDHPLMTIRVLVLGRPAGYGEAAMTIPVHQPYPLSSDLNCLNITSPADHRGVFNWLSLGTSYASPVLA